MSWNHRAKIFAMGVSIQTTPGTFDAPGSADLLAVGNPDLTIDNITAEDPTQTGSIWDSPPVYLGQTGTMTGTIPIRGPGGSAPPAANDFVIGRILQAAGFAEIRRATAQAATALGVGSTTTEMVLANTESAVDDFLLGCPIRSADIGTGFRGDTLIRDYIGSTKTAILAETLGGAPTAQYVLPAGLTYRLGTLVTTPPILSLSIWRDKVRYDLRDASISSFSIDAPVSNEFNTSFPTIQFSVKGVFHARTDDTTPTLPDEILNVAVGANRAGKFFLDDVMLGHAGATLNLGIETSAASNANQDAGQDGYDIISGSRSVELDLNQMNATDFDIQQRIDDRSVIGLLNTWRGGGNGNRIGMLLPNLTLDPQRPAERNGYVSLTGNANPVGVDNSAVLAFWYD